MTTRTESAAVLTYHAWCAVKDAADRAKETGQHALADALSLAQDMLMDAPDRAFWNGVEETQEEIRILKAESRAQDAAIEASYNNPQI